MNTLRGFSFSADDIKKETAKVASDVGNSILDVGKDLLASVIPDDIKEDGAKAIAIATDDEGIIAGIIKAGGDALANTAERKAAEEAARLADRIAGTSEKEAKEKAAAAAAIAKTQAAATEKARLAAIAAAAALKAKQARAVAFFKALAAGLEKLRTDAKARADYYNTMAAKIAKETNPTTKAQLQKMVAATSQWLRDHPPTVREKTAQWISVIYALSVLRAKMDPAYATQLFAKLKADAGNDPNKQRDAELFKLAVQNFQPTAQQVQIYRDWAASEEQKKIAAQKLGVGGGGGGFLAMAAAVIGGIFLFGG